MTTNPFHLGDILREGVTAELGLSVTEKAKRVGMSYAVFLRVLNGYSGCSFDLAY